MFLVFLVLGIMVSTQFRSAEMQRSHNINQQRAEDLVEKLKTSEKGKRRPFRNGSRNWKKPVQATAIPRKPFAMKMRAGEVTMQGPASK